MTKFTKIALAAAFAFAFAFSASAYVVGSPTLMKGSSGADVMALQADLNAKTGTMLTVDGAFGSGTEAAVKTFQSAHAIMADGKVGPQTAGVLNGMMAMGGGVVYAPGCSAGTGFSSTTGLPCTTVTTPVVEGCVAGAMFSSTTGEACDDGEDNGGDDNNDNNGALEGDAGSITVTDDSTYSSEEVSEGDEEVPVLQFNIEADSGSDVEITSVKVELEQTTAADSDKLEDYISSVAIMMDGEIVGEVDADEFSENSDIYTKSISLDGAIIRADDDMDFQVVVTALGNLDSGDIDTDSFSVDVLTVRFEDAEGVVTTEDTDGDALDQTFDFEDLASSGDLEAKITEGNDNPDAMTVEADDTSDTNDVLLLAFDFSAEGSDMTIDELEFNISPIGANANEIVKKFTLVMDGEEIDSMSSPSIASTVTDQITFTDLEDELEIAMDSEVTFELFADINDFDGAFGNGDSIEANLTSTNFSVAGADAAEGAVIDDENGDTIVDGDRAGSVDGEAQTFYTDGISVELVSTDSDAFSVDSTDNDRVELTIVFDVTAFGQDAYIPSFMTPTTAATNATVGTASTGTAPTTASGVAFHAQSSDAGLTIAMLSGSTLSSTAEEKTNSYKVVDGSTETFTLKVVVTNAGGALDSAAVRAVLAGVNFGDTDSATGDFVFTSDLTDTFKTEYSTIAD